MQSAKRRRRGAYFWEIDSMRMEQVSANCFAVLNEKNRVCDANSGLINLGGGVVIDTQSDLPHGRQMIKLFGKVWPGMPKRVINTHEDADHVWGNQLFEGAEIIAHRTAAERMKHVADPKETRQLIKAARSFLPRAGETRLNGMHWEVESATKIAQQYVLRLGLRFQLSLLTVVCAIM
jgi:glyoxylase-like metal-dependent hydrolase (beta-lactamase superfamily II)